MLNTGLTLRKPLESTYGAAHRFLAANSGIKIPDMLKELRAFEHNNEFHYPGYYSLLAQRHEQQFCQQHQLPYILPEPIPYALKIRNCAQCAAIGYHSMTYQWKWLTHCPVHKIPLTEQCPACHRPWPSVSELLRCHCAICGWPISRHQLIQADAFTASWPAFETLQVIKLEYQSRVKVRLTALANSIYALDEHQCVSIMHQDFASIYAQQFPARRRQLVSENYSLQKVTRFVFPFPLDGKKNHWRNDRDSLYQQVLGLRDHVSGQIVTAIEEYRQRPLEIPSFYDMEFFGLNEQTDSYLLAFLYWRKLVNTGIGSNRKPPRSKYFDVGTGTHPLIPVPMCNLAVATDSENDLDSGFNLPSRLPAPLGLTLKVYELDLWWCFRSILKYFDTLKVHRESTSLSRLYQELPEWAWPGANYNDGISVFLNEYNKLELIMLASRLKYTLDDLELQEI